MRQLCCKISAWFCSFCFKSSSVPPSLKWKRVKFTFALRHTINLITQARQDYSGSSGKNSTAKNKMVWLGLNESFQISSLSASEIWLSAGRGLQGKLITAKECEGPWLIPGGSWFCKDKWHQKRCPHMDYCVKTPWEQISPCTMLSPFQNGCLYLIAVRMDRRKRCWVPSKFSFSSGMCWHHMEWMRPSLMVCDLPGSTSVLYNLLLPHPDLQQGALCKITSLLPWDPHAIARWSTWTSVWTRERS